jgi:hypothetical protein
MPNVFMLVAGVVFVALAAANVVLMLETSRPSRKAAARARLITAHRVGGYLFVIFFSIMAYSMSQRLAGLGITGHLPMYLVLHITLALLLAPLILLKVLVARRYKQSQSMLKALGIAIFIIAFVLVSIPVLAELLRSASTGDLGMKLATALVVGVCLIQCALIFKKRERSRVPEESLRLPKTSARPAVAATYQGSSGPIQLVLVTTEQQTHDTKTLRFRILDESNLHAKPGQFLTFHWAIDGKQVPRSYTISSSPMDGGYVEITP